MTPLNLGRVKRGRGLNWGLTVAFKAFDQLTYHDAILWPTFVQLILV